jgi:hypothetical protein
MYAIQRDQRRVGDQIERGGGNLALWHRYSLPVPERRGSKKSGCGILPFAKKPFIIKLAAF